MNISIVFFYFRICVFLCIVSALVACQVLPKQPHLPKSTHLTQQAQSHHNQKSSALIHTLNHQHANNPQLSGYHPISTGANAFAARSILADMATQTINIQYYIWHNDEAGQLMLKDLWEAAQRGVIVRLLLDDMNSSQDLDELLYHFAQHPNIAVRLMNPLPNRKWRMLNVVARPLRTNARMHNKSMTIDNRISVIGGRNIGNEYLNNTDSSNFADLDVLLVGSVVQDINQSFESYWNSPLAYDIQSLVNPRHNLFESLHDAVFEDYLSSQSTSSNERALRTYRTALQSSTIGEDLLNKKIAFRWANIQLFADPVEKLINSKKTKDTHLVARLQKKLGQPHSHFSVISSYFVPTKQGVDTLTKLAKTGVKISILTNSFDATDVNIVHAGYAHWRKDLLLAGVNLYEIRSTISKEDAKKFWKNNKNSSTSLHAKAFAVDDAWVFIGSYNIDPRSANINTELGVLIEDSWLASQFHHALSGKSTLIEQAYQLKLDDAGNIQWHTIKNGQHIIYPKEPNTSFIQRSGTTLLSWLPIDWLL